MMIVVRPCIASLKRESDAGLGRRVHRRGRVVEDEDARVDEQRACDRNALPLTARERDPALADERVVAVRQPLDELVCLRCARSPFHVGERGVREPEGDVLPHRRRKEERILRDDP